MNSSLSVVLITKNNQDTIFEVTSALKGFGEVIVVDSNSTDKTVETIKKTIPKAKIFQKDFGQNIGLQRKYGLNYVTNDWVLLLDSDEIISAELAKEIKSTISNPKLNDSAFEIPYQNYFLGRPVNYGGENYKMTRLFRKDSLDIRPSILHNQLVVKKGRVKKLTGKIVHHSYRSLGQVYSKFTDYGVRMAEIKAEAGEKSSFRKIFLYPVHMFWARFIKDNGYRDGLFRIPLDLGFAYMEWLTYTYLSILNLKSKISKPKPQT